MSTELFSSELPDLDSFIKELDLLDKNVQTAIQHAMKSGAQKICAAQRRRLLEGNPKLMRISSHITLGPLKVNRRGSVSITSGYQPEAFKSGGNKENIGVIGLTYEFGRPGESPKRNKKTMRQFRRGKHVDISKGNIAPIPHIRRGFDDEINAAVEEVITSTENEIGKVFNE